MPLLFHPISAYKGFVGSLYFRTAGETTIVCCTACMFSKAEFHCTHTPFHSHTGMVTNF